MKYLVVFLFGITCGAAFVMAQNTEATPGARLTLLSSEPLEEPRPPKAKAEGNKEAEAKRPVRPAVLELKTAGDPILLDDEVEQDQETGAWRNVRRPKVERFSRDGKGIAARGYDIVSYLGGAPAKGRKEFFSEHGGVVWLFASEENRKLFEQNPERYTPQYGGFCAYSVSKGYPATADPLVYLVDGGKLYFFFDKAVRGVWEQDRGSARRADRHWPAMHR